MLNHINLAVPTGTTHCLLMLCGFLATYVYYQLNYQDIVQCITNTVDFLKNSEEGVIAKVLLIITLTLMISP